MQARSGERGPGSLMLDTVFILSESDRPNATPTSNKMYKKPLE